MIRVLGLPLHSPLGLLIDTAWACAFLLSIPLVSSALFEARRDDRYRLMRKINGRIAIEARRAIRTETMRLVIAMLYAALGVSALLTPERQPLTANGAVILVIFLVIGGLTIGQTIFDRRDRREQIRILALEGVRESITKEVP